MVVVEVVVEVVVVEDPVAPDFATVVDVGDVEVVTFAPEAPPGTVVDVDELDDEDELLDEELLELDDEDELDDELLELEDDPPADRTIDLIGRDCAVMLVSIVM